MQIADKNVFNFNKNNRLLMRQSIFKVFNFDYRRSNSPIATKQYLCLESAFFVEKPALLLR